MSKVLIALIINISCMTCYFVGKYAFGLEYDVLSLFLIVQFAAVGYQIGLGSKP